MKKIMRTFALMAVAALGLSACTGEKLVPDNGNADGKFVMVHFGAETAIEGATKATLTPNEAETMFTSVWEKDKDAIYVSYENGGAKLTTTTGTWNGTTFLANLPAYTGMWKYQACYPCPTNEEVPFGSERKQSGNLYNSDYDIMISSKVNVNNGAAGKDDNGNDIVFQMDRQTGIVYFHLTSSLEEEVVSAKLSVEGGNIASSYALLGPSGFTAEPDLKEITITFTEAPTAKDIRLWFNVLPTSYTSMSLVVETTGHTLTLNNSNPGTFAAQKLYKVKGDVSSKWIKKGGETPEPTVYVWDLSINSTSEASVEQIGWTNDAADMLCVKGKSTTDANNYYPGKSNYSSTRFYTNSTLSITPKVGKSLYYYVFKATTDSYAKALVNSTWTNATASVDAVNAEVVYIVATDPTKAVSAKIGATCGFTKVECHTKALSLTPVIKPASTSITVPSNGGEQSITYTIQYPEDGKTLTAVSSEAWINSINCGTAGTVSFVAEENVGAKRKATITLSYPGAEDVAVTVSQSAAGAIGGPTWNRVSSVDDLLSGGTFIIGYESDANSGVIVPMRNTATATTTKAGYIYSGIENNNKGTINMSTITDTANYEVTIIASSSVTGAICIKIGDKFIGNTNTKNECKLFDKEANTTSFTPTIGKNDVVILKITANQTYHTLQYNIGAPRFAVYNGKQKSVVIYKKN